eukprot:scaffold1827_cov421-Prasinococcus_capsulatus_cf.AAC.52
MLRPPSGYSAVAGGRASIDGAPRTPGGSHNHAPGGHRRAGMGSAASAVVAAAAAAEPGCGLRARSPQ